MLAQLGELAVDSIDSQDVPHALTDLIGDLTAAIPSYAGLRLTLIHTGHPVTLTAFTNLDHTPVTTSLRLPLTLTAPGRYEPGSDAVFWAHTPGAFVDLAADLNHALHSQQDLHRTRPHTGGSPGGSGLQRNDGRHPEDPKPAPITLDADLPPHPLESGITGLSGLSTLNRAIGLLIARGYEPDYAKQKLRSEAEAAGVPIDQIAEQLLN